MYKSKIASKFRIVQSLPKPNFRIFPAHQKDPLCPFAITPIPTYSPEKPAVYIQSVNISFSGYFLQIES